MKKSSTRIEKHQNLLSHAEKRVAAERSLLSDGNQGMESDPSGSIFDIESMYAWKQRLLVIHCNNLLDKNEVPFSWTARIECTWLEHGIRDLYMMASKIWNILLELACPITLMLALSLLSYLATNLSILHYPGWTFSRFDSKLSWLARLFDRVDCKSEWEFV